MRPCNSGAVLEYRTYTIYTNHQNFNIFRMHSYKSALFIYSMLFRGGDFASFFCQLNTKGFQQQRTKLSASLIEPSQTKRPTVISSQQTNVLENSTSWGEHISKKYCTRFFRMRLLTGCVERTLRKHTVYSRTFPNMS